LNLVTTLWLAGRGVYRGHQGNVEKAIALARDADRLFIEAPFLEVDVDFAARSRHLTARQAGDIARCAHVARLIPFHFSARYRERENELLCEAETAFSAGSACGSIL
jgi:ribonuclease Z